MAEATTELSCTSLFRLVRGDLPWKPSSQVVASTAASFVPFSANLGSPFCSASIASGMSAVKIASQLLAQNLKGRLSPGLLLSSWLMNLSAVLALALTISTMMSASPRTSAPELLGTDLREATQRLQYGVCLHVCAIRSLAADRTLVHRLVSRRVAVKSKGERKMKLRDREVFIFAGCSDGDCYSAKKTRAFIEEFGCLFTFNHVWCLD